MNRPKNNIIKIRKLVCLARQLAPSILVFLTLMTNGFEAAGDNIQPKKHATSLGDYLAGRHAMFINDANSAVRYLRSNLLDNPNNIEIQSQLFTILVYQGKVKESLILAEKLAKTPNENVNLPLLVLALRDIRGGDYVRANKKLSKLPTSGIHAFAVPMIRAWTLVAKKKYDEASKILKNRMNNPGFIALYAPHAGLINELAGNVEISKKLFKDALKQYRRIGANLTRIAGDFYKRNNMNFEAKTLYLNFLDSNPNSYLFNRATKRLKVKNSKILDKISPAVGIAEALFSLSRSIQRQDPYQGIIWTQLALFIHPEFSFAKLRLADALTREDNLHQALFVYKSISKDPKFSSISRLRVARTFNFLNKIDDAAGVLNAMASEDKNAIAPLVTLGSMYRGREMYRDAVNAFSKAKKRVKAWKKHHWQLLYGNGASLERLQEWPEAEKNFLKALELNPNEPTTLNYLGYSWLEQRKNLKQAYKMIKNAVRQKPQTAYIIDSLGWAQYQLGDFKGAMKNLERAVLLDPADPTINEHLGDVYWKVGRKLEAQYQWRRSLSLEPDKSQISVIEMKIKNGLPNI